MPHATGPALTGRDLAVLLDVHKHRYLSVSQIARLHFPSRQTAYRRLRALTELKLLVGFTAPAITEHIYYLSRQGAGAIAGALGIAHDQLSWSEATRAPKDYYFLSHFLEVTDFRITLSKACQDSELQLLGFIPEFLGRRTAGGGLKKHIRDIVCDIQQPAEGFSHTPDAVFALTKGGSPALFFLEIDRGTEVISDPDKGVLKACRFYLNYLVAGGYQRYSDDFGCTAFRGFRALFVTTSTQRLENMRKAVSSLNIDEKAKKFLWFVTAGQVNNTTFFQTAWVSGDCRDSTLYRIG